MTEYKIKPFICPQSCPKCGSSNIQAAPFNPEGDNIKVECQEPECQFEWNELYIFHEWEPVE